MTRKILGITFSFFLIGLVGAPTLDAKDIDGEKMAIKTVLTSRTFARPSDGQHEGFGGGSGAGFPVTVNLGANSLPSTISSSPGIQVGVTFYDYQKNGSVNRQIATNGINHCLYFGWMNQDNNSAVGGRNVRGNTWDAALGNLSQQSGVGIDIGGSVDPPDRSGYTTMDAFSDGRAVNAHHYDPAFSSPGHFHPFAFVNDLPCLVDFVEMVSGGLVPDAIYEDSISPGGQSGTFLWPRVAASSGGGCGKVVHMLIHDDGNTGYYMYLRRTVTVGNVNATDSVWSNVYRFGLGGYLSPTIEASRNSDRVVIAWAGGRGDGSEFGASVDRFNGLISGQTDNDLFYMTSENCGITWNPIRNVTQYPNDSIGNYRADSRVTAIFDHQDSVNIAWTAAQWFGYSGPFPYAGRIFHWHEGRPTGWNTPGGIRSAVAGEWTPTNCNPGVFNINVTQPQLSSCDTLLYLTYGEYANPLRGHGDDCHVRFPSAPAGAANGDIMLTVSANRGFNWDPARDLTGTYTPNCDTIPGGANPDCDSDAWHSTTRYGINTDGDIFGMEDVSPGLGGYAGDDYLFVFYVNDRIPGGAIRPEGAWILNPLKTFKFGCVDIVPAAVL
ncbi:MAG: hypothetical protein IIB00_08900, partial [candidate division Zixibacteria bacterium]|nr:hypothetical protein [candidate division Zixibacteria bacterium]